MDANEQRISDLLEQLVLAETTLEALKATTPDVVRAAEDAAYETAAVRLEEYAQAKLSGVAYSAAVICAMNVRLLKSTN